MSKWIDAEWLLNRYKGHHDFYLNAWGGDFKAMDAKDKARCDELNTCIADIFNAPSIDIEPKRGEWKRRIVDNGFNADWVCSECGYRVKTDFVDYNFCPNCGADMREREGE